jgi:BirA family biotin operon repressor/biotin-[acetyl-CoA-carboxylase] ligase
MIDPRRFERVPRIDSTSAELMRRPFGAVPQPPCALLADAQEAGRGRNGRGWLSDPSRSIALSVAVERASDGAPLVGLPLAIGVAVTEVLAAHGAQTRVKWPNDVFVERGGGLAKAGGILVEVRQQGPLQRVVAGVGLNLVSSRVLDDPRIAQAAAALFDESDAPPREPLARELAAAIVRAIEAFARTGLAPWLARWRALDALDGRPIELLRPDGTRQPAVARGIDEDGSLRVERGDGTIERLIAGEVAVRPGARR